MSENSLVEQIRKIKNRLKSQTTVVTSTDGMRYLEEIKGNGEVRVTELEKVPYGFVVDERPDLKLAEILPYLFLSSQDVVHDINLLIANKITHILSIGVVVPPCIHAPHIIYKNINLLDLPEANVLSVLDECFEYIELAHVKDNYNRILVHCNAGFSRSPAVIIAYLMKKFKFPFTKAFQMVKEQRNIHPNYGFITQLKQYEKELLGEIISY